MANDNAAQSSNLAPVKALQTGEAIIEGKIQAVEQPKESEFMYYTIVGKAQDEYTRGSTIQVSQPANQRPFAKEGDIVKIKVLLGGYGRRYNGNLYITNTLNFVEFA